MPFITSTIGPGTHRSLAKMSTVFCEQNNMKIILEWKPTCSRHKITQENSSSRESVSRQTETRRGPFLSRKCFSYTPLVTFFEDDMSLYLPWYSQYSLQYCNLTEGKYPIMMLFPGRIHVKNIPYYMWLSELLLRPGRNLYWKSSPCCSRWRKRFF
jgi:hypothetical protein